MARAQTRTPRTGSSRPIQPLSGRAVISGHVLKVIRESLLFTQERLAECLNIEINTIQGWESGRRPLTSTSVSNLMRLRRRLRQLGAKPHVLDALNDAIDADCFLDYVFSTDLSAVEPDDHPLATWVMKRSFNEMVAWPLLGTKPTALEQTPVPARRRGPVPEVPVLTSAEKYMLFENLRTAVEKSHSTHGQAFDSEQARLLRRQAYFLSSLDRSQEMQGWLEQMAKREGSRLPDLGAWSPGWVTARSMAVARARVGDPDPLRWFIDKALASDAGHTADLNYWAYWLGLIPESHHGDAFMVDRSVTWYGLSLLRRLSDILPTSRTTVDIYAHSIWALLRDCPHILQEDPTAALQLYHRVAALLEQPDTVGPESRRKLESLYYGLQLMLANLKMLSPPGAGS